MPVPFSASAVSGIASIPAEYLTESEGDSRYISGTKSSTHTDITSTSTVIPDGKAVHDYVANNASGGGGAPTSNPTFTGTVTVNNAGSTLGQLAVESHAVIGGDLVLSGQSTSITADTIQDSVGNHYKTVASTWNATSTHPVEQAGLHTHLCAFVR